MQKLVYFPLLSLLTTSLFAQRQISGTVQNAAGQPLAYANVLLLSVSDSSLVKGVVSEENGQFSVEELENEACLLSVSLIGYQSQLQKLPDSFQAVLQLPPTILQEMEAELQEITDRMAVHYLQVTSFYNSETCDYGSMILMDYLKLENFTDYMAIWIKG